MFGLILEPSSIINRLNSVKEIFMNRKNSLYKDVVTGIFFTTGILGFVSGEFVLSTMFFGAASLFTNLDFESASQS